MQKITEETRAKLRASHLGQVAWNKGKKWSPEVIEKFRKAKLGKVCSEETKQKMRMTHRRLNSVARLRSGFGPQAANWQGGKTSKAKLIRNSTQYANWRKQVFERDEYKCQLCGCHNGNGKTIELHADHIKPFAFHPELRFELSNGRTLCVDCHRATDTYGHRAVKRDKH